MISEKVTSLDLSDVLCEVEITACWQRYLVNDKRLIKCQLSSTLPSLLPDSKNAKWTQMLCLLLSWTLQHKDHLMVCKEALQGASNGLNVTYMWYPENNVSHLSTQCLIFLCPRARFPHPTIALTLAKCNYTATR